MSNKIKMRFFSVISIVLLCIGLTYKTLQNDTFYIIKLGSDILKNGVDLVDHYCWITHLSYTYPHWLFDVFINIIYSNYGYLGIYVSTVILFVILILSIYYINLKFTKNELLSLVFSIVIINCLNGFPSARAHLISSILFLWQVYFIEMLIKDGKKKYILFLAVISLLVANLHATIWPFYFILYLPFIGQHVIYYILKKFNKVSSNSFLNNKLIITGINNFRLLVISIFSGFLMGFLSPSKICFTYIFKVIKGNSQIFIEEHAPLVLINNLPFLLFIIVILFVLIFTKVKVKLKDLFMISGLIFMSLCSKRHIAFFYIIGLIYVVFLINSYFKLSNDNSLDILYKRFVNNKFLYVLLIVLVMFVSSFNLKISLSGDYVPKDIYPVNAVKYIKENLDISKLRLYNDYDFGAYLLFNDIYVFVDSRCDLYLKEFNGLDYSIFDDSMNIRYNYEEKFKFYSISHVLIYKKDILYKILGNDINYKEIYKDRYFVLFEKVND